MNLSRSLLAMSASLTTLSISLSSAQAGGLFSTEPAPSGFYGGVFGGLNFPSDTEFRGVSDPVTGIPGPTGSAGVPLNVDLDYDTGFTVGGALGVQLPFRYWKVFHPRVEVEVSYLDFGVEGGSFNGGAQVFGGDQEAIALYLNNYSDLVFSENQRFTPYVGGGLGVAFVDSAASYFPPALSAPNFAVAGEDTAFASHIAVGATYDLTDAVELYSEGRYFRIRDVQLERRFIGGGADLFNGDVDDDISGITLTGGLRVRF